MDGEDVASRRRLRRVLRAVGLLEPARRARELVRAARGTRRNARYWRRGAPDGLPLPPARLIGLVTGTPDVEWFLLGGERAAESIRAALARNGIDPARLHAILDFGCGLGRVLRHLKDLPAERHGADLNPRLIAWCQRRLGVGRFVVNGLRPPLPYPDGRFDLVYALSVFTHLPEDLQRPWIEELARVLAPGGHLLITTHGARYREELTPDERRRFDAGALVLRNDDAAGLNVCGAYHPEAYVRGTLARGLEVVDFVPEGARGNPHQDLYLIGKT
jgi:SAM-dependent methyltransferase